MPTMLPLTVGCGEPDCRLAEPPLLPLLNG